MICIVSCKRNCQVITKSSVYQIDLFFCLSNFQFFPSLQNLEDQFFIVATLFAAGAGASTKVVLPYEIPAPGSKNGRMTNLIRIENVRDVGEYISRIDEMIERKGEWLWH